MPGFLIRAFKKLSVLERIFLGAFIFWAIAGLFFTVTPITQVQVTAWGLPVWATEFGALCLKWGDPALILVAFLNSHLVATRQWGTKSARVWGAQVLVIAATIETAGVLSGDIFGPYHYTDEFGPLLGVIPITIPMAWHIVLTNCLLITRRMRPDLSIRMEAACVATMATLYDFLLEPFATQVKHYWIWESGAIPLQNYVAWWVLGFVLTWLLAPSHSSAWRNDPRPWLLIGFTLLIFVAGRVFSHVH